MKSTGEVMGVGNSFAEAFAKAQYGAGVLLPASGKAFISVKDADKETTIEIARDLQGLGYELIATGGTAQALQDNGLECSVINKVYQGQPHIVDMIKNDEISLIVNTTLGKKAIADSYTIRREALNHKVTYTTTMAGARALALALAQLDGETVTSLQELHKEAS